MQAPVFQSCVEFVAISAAVPAAYLTAVWVITGTMRLIGRFRPPVPESPRPGEMIHQALKVSGRALDHGRTAALLFGVSVFLLFNFGRTGWWAPQPVPVNAAILLGLLVPLGYGAFRLIQLTRHRGRWKQLLHLHRQVARRLVDVQVRGYRVFPSVPLADGILDNVVVGPNGVYTVQLITPPPGAESVSFERGGLTFQPGGTRLSLQAMNKRVAALARHLGERAGSDICVLPVLTVPDCRIESGDANGPMLVSLQACSAFVGWQHENFFLHEDDIANLSGCLSEMSMQNPPATVSAAVEALARQTGSPVTA